MRTVGLCLATLVAILVGALSGADAARRSTAPTCPPRRAHVLLSDAQASIYWHPELGETGVEEGSEVEACASGHHAVPVREIFTFADNVPPCDQGCLRKGWRHTIALTSSVLAYATDSGEDTKYGSCYCERWGIAVRNLRTGRLLHDVPTGPHRGNNVDDYYVGVGPAERVVVEADGSVAWTVRNFIRWDEAFRAGREATLSYEVRAISHSHERVLAAGPNLNPGSLSLHHNRLDWVQGGKRFFALLG
jgi:hypothetical protein